MAALMGTAKNPAKNPSMPSSSMAERRSRPKYASSMAKMLPQVGEKVGAEAALGRGRRHTRDAKASGESHDAEREQDGAGEPCAVVECVREKGAGDRAGEDGEECPQLDDAIAPGEFLGR